MPIVSNHVWLDTKWLWFLWQHLSDKIIHYINNRYCCSIVDIRNGNVDADIRRKATWYGLNKFFAMNFLGVCNSNICSIYHGYEIFTVKICMTLTLTVRMSRDQISMHYSIANRWLPMYRQEQYFFYLSSFMRYSQSKIAWPWLLPLEWSKVKCKYTIRKPIGDLLFIGNCNICPICHCFQDIHCQNFDDLHFDL